MCTHRKLRRRCLLHPSQKTKQLRSKHTGGGVRLLITANAETYGAGYVTAATWFHLYRVQTEREPVSMFREHKTQHGERK